MNKRFQHGLVVGKFSPLHRGHELVIRRAISECEQVSLLSYSQPELPGCEAARREQWVARLFPGVRHLAVNDARLREWVRGGDGPAEVPHNDAEAVVHRRFCAYLCRRILGVFVDAVFTSEDYGDGFAVELTWCFRAENPHCPAVTHVLVDRARLQLPISGTILRGDIHTNRAWLAPEVYGTFVKRVCLLGGESSGKSTLAACLANEFQTTHVAEFGRELWEQKAGALAYPDLLHIAREQVAREEAAAGQAHRLLFCDTSPLTTLFYSRHMFQMADPALERLAGRAYDLTVLCAPDFPFVQDGTRQPESFRQQQHAWYIEELNRRQIPFHLVIGPFENRLHQLRPLLDRL